MGRRVAVSSMGTRLCLLYLLEGWLASRLALLAAANENLIAQTTPLGLSQTISTRKLNGTQGVMMNISCPQGQFIHIIKATWGAKMCPTTYDRTNLVRKICEDKQECKLLPVTNNDPNVFAVNMGAPCRLLKKNLKASIACRSPCNKFTCAEGKCVATTSKSYICDCNPGYVNKLGARSSPCIKNVCEPNPCGRGTCERTNGNTGHKCHCPTGEKFVSGTCKAYDMCEDSPSPCPKGASCSDGYGKLPKCTCPEFHTEKEGSCVAKDTCDDLECPPGAVCKDGVGKQGTCQCQKYHELRNRICEPVDQCLIDNGGCDPKATCTDGVGKPATCRCPAGYALKAEECVFVNSCLIDNGGCHQNASCELKEGEVKCTCKEGFIGDGQVCHGPGSFIFPDNGTIKMILRRAKGKIFYNLGKCFSLVTDPKTNYYNVMSTDRVPQTHTGSDQQSETMEGGKFTITLHREQDVIKVFINAHPKGFTQPRPPIIIERPWDDSCDIENITVQDDRGTQTEVELLLTTNIFARRSFVGDT